MMFRNSVCALCGKVPPALGFQELPGEEQGPPRPPLKAELERLWALRDEPEGKCPRCSRAISLHLARIAANQNLLGSTTDTNVARAIKAPVIMVRNVREMLEIPAAGEKAARRSG